MNDSGCNWQKPNAPMRTWSRINCFQKDQNGTVTIFGLFILVMMLIVSGMAIDIVRHEQKRVRIQTTLDRAVLAAADLGQLNSPEAVVQDYIDKANLGSVTVTIPPATDELDLRRVQVKATQQSDSMFLNMVGIPSMAVNASSQAEEKVTNIEISLVLDISGSMRFASSAGNTKIFHLRNAAEDFVDLVLTGPSASTSTINLVPYAGQVNPGPFLFDAVGGVRQHRYSSCIQLEDADFLGSGLPTVSTTQVAHFMQWPIAPAFMQWGWCPSEDASIIVASNNHTELVDQIRNMPLHDGTGTHAGMKWGLALLDPTSNDEIRAMNGQSLSLVGETYDDPDEIPSGLPSLTSSYTYPANLVLDAFEDRPAAWGSADTSKFIVLMTDGNITPQYTPKFRGYSDDDADVADNEPDADNVDGIHYDYENAQVEAQNQDGSLKSTLLTTRAQNVDNFKRVCDQARAEGIKVFTIAYEVADTSQAAGEMRYCATTDSDYHNVSGLDISKAFEAIAREIFALRLTN